MRWWERAFWVPGPLRFCVSGWKDGPSVGGRGINKACDQSTEEEALDPIKLCLWPLPEMEGLEATLAPPSGGPASGRSQTACKAPRAWVTLRGGDWVATPIPTHRRFPGAAGPGQGGAQPHRCGSGEPLSLSRCLSVPKPWSLRLFQTLAI